jgi:hypothetical protein
MFFIALWVFLLSNKYMYEFTNIGGGGGGCKLVMKTGSSGRHGILPPLQDGGP